MPTVQNAVQYAIGKTIEKDRPRIETGHCLDVKKQTDPCGICSEICPTGATLDCRDHNWDECIDCNLCAAACPTRALRSSAVNIDRLLQAAGSGASELTVACEQNPSGAFLQTYCMGSIPWEVLAQCALDKTVLLNMDRCESCPETAGYEQLKKTLRKVHAFLGKEYFDSHFKLARNGESGFSRRETFSFLRTKGKALAENMLIRDQTAPVTGSFFRQELVSRLDNPKPTDPEFTLETLVFNDNCWACNLCRNACPSKALTIEHDEEASEYYVVHDPILCTQCGICKAVCKDEAIDGFITFKTRKPTLPLANLASPSVCSECGRNFKPNGDAICLRCIKVAERKEREEKEAEERRVRIEKMKEENAIKLAEQEAAREAAEKEVAAQAGSAVPGSAEPGESAPV